MNKRWIVELVQGNPHLIRLKYLSASDDAFLLGMTGKRVLQALPNSAMDGSIEWEPIKEGYQVKLRTRGGKFLRANGATPPWRNSITHDLPHRTATQDWVLWDVDVIDISLLYSEFLHSYPSTLSSYSSFADDDFTDISPSVSAIPSCPSISSNRSSYSTSRQNGMEFFDRAQAVRLQSHLGKYLLADEDEQTQPFLLGMTGKKVLQPLSTKNTDTSIEWEPIKEGLHVKLRTSGGTYLRANGATRPWRNSVIHDVPSRTATQYWVMWGVEVVDITISDTSESVSSCSLPASSFNSVLDDYTTSPDIGSPNVARYQSKSSKNTTRNRKNSRMEFFQKAKSVRLKSTHDKFLLADPNQEAVYQDRHGTSRSAVWTIEFPEEIENVIRLKSCYGKYLTATDDQVIGFTGRKVIQNLPRKLDSSIEHHQWILWEVDIVEILPESTEKITQLDDDSSSFHFTSPTHSETESGEAFGASMVKAEGRLIYYHVADENGNANDAVEGPSFHFKGHGLEELTQKLEEITGLENITVCSRNKINGNLYPLRLALPPNNADMHVVVVPASS
ncbi:unnamed protein product [Withania somnifera]